MVEEKSSSFIISGWYSWKGKVLRIAYATVSHLQFCLSLASRVCFPGKHQFMEWTSPLWPATSHIRHILLKLSVAQRVKEAIKNRFLRKLIFIQSLAPNFLVNKISRVHDPPHSLWCLRGLFNYPFLDLTIRYCLGWSVGMTLPTKRDNFKLLCRYISWPCNWRSFSFPLPPPERTRTNVEKYRRQLETKSPFCYDNSFSTHA